MAGPVFSFGGGLYRRTFIFLTPTPDPGAAQGAAAELLLGGLGGDLGVGVLGSIGGGRSAEEECYEEEIHI